MTEPLIWKKFPVGSKVEYWGMTNSWEPGEVIQHYLLGILPYYPTVQIKTSDSKEENYTSLSLSGLLNALDGVSSPDDCIIIMTSNHIDRIDAALIRPGRIDRKFLIDLMETEQVLEMFKNFFPGEHKELTVLRSYIDRVKLAPAEWQALFLDNKDNFDLLISKVKDKSMPGKNNNTHNELPISWMGT